MQNLYNPPLPSYSRSVMSAGHNCCTRLYLVHPIFEFIFCLCECKSFCVTSKSPQYHAVCCCSRFFLRKGVKRDAYLRYLTQRILFLRVVLIFFFSHHIAQPTWLGFLDALHICLQTPYTIYAYVYVEIQQLCSFMFF